MTVDKKELLDALNSVSPALGAKDNGMQQDCFIFYGGYLLAFDDDICIHYALTQDMVDAFGDIAISAKEFYALVQKLPGNQLDIEATDEGLAIKAGRSRSKLKAQRELKMPLKELCAWGDEAQDLPDSFTKALIMTSPACSNDMTKPLSTCVYLNEDHMMATDNSCATRYKFDNFKWRVASYLPKATAAVLSKYELSNYCLKADNWMRFSTVDENTIIDCRTYYKGQPFVEVGPLFNEHGPELKLPKKLAGSLERANIFAKSIEGLTLNNPFVKIEVDTGRLVVAAWGAAGEYQEAMRIDYEGEHKSFYIDADLLVRILDEKYTCELCKNFIRIYDSHYDYLAAYRALTND